jgi:hypothetical protein
MIAFVTLLLGLISGVYPIEVKVGGPVAAVELTLDGAPAGRITHAPWRAEVDLGPELKPHELIARALDDKGGEIARAKQWINLPRPPAEVEIVLEKGSDGTPSRAQLIWQSVDGVKPEKIALVLDGLPLKADAAGGAPLPALSLKSLHVLSADLRFPSGVTAHRDSIYGGEYGSAVSTELTAVPVRLTGRKPLPAADQLGGWLTVDGRPGSVAAVEEGAGKITVVCMPTVSELLSRLAPTQKRAMTLPVLRTLMPLGPDNHLQYLALSSSPFHDSRIPADLFQLSPPLDGSDGGMYYLLTNKRLVGEANGPRRIADAVSVAGLKAAADNHRRAVLLVLGKDVPDAFGLYDPPKVRRYLESIRVPLFVWSLYGKDAAAAQAWGPVEDVSSLARMGDAMARLRAELDAQRIVWLDGSHLPQAIALGPAAQGVELVGKP